MQSGTKVAKNRNCDFCNAHLLKKTYELRKENMLSKKFRAAYIRIKSYIDYRSFYYDVFPCIVLFLAGFLPFTVTSYLCSP